MKEVPLYFHIDYKFSHCLDLENSEFPNVEEIHGEIYAYDCHDTRTKVGEVQLHYYNDSFIDLGFNLYDAFDRSMDTIRLGNAILDSGTGDMSIDLKDQIGPSFNNNILVIHEIILFPDFRGKGFGREIISGIITFFKGKCGYVALQSFPKQHDISIKDKPRFQEFGLDQLNPEFHSAQQSLDSFYEKCGFQKIPVQNESFFIMNIDPM